MNRLLDHFLRSFVQVGTLEVIGASGIRSRYGNNNGPRAAIRFTTRSAEQRLLLNPPLVLGELYMDGGIVVECGSIYEVLLVATQNLARQANSKLLKLHARVKTSFRPLTQRNSKRNARRNVAHHYDLDGRLYDLFLDADRQYSCAYFERPEQSLDEAQLAKRRHVAAKLLIEPGASVLDIGSGWGGLALYLAEQCSAHVTGITLSEEQLGVARKRAAASCAGGKAKFELQDYRSVEGPFDRIVSVGMFEHVGVSYYDTFFRKISEILADDGVMLLHSIGSIDGPGTTNPWMAKYIFPGGYAPALSEVLPAIERAGLIVTDIEILHIHYAQTLKAWRERFLTRREEALALYGERFCRMWEFYLAGCEASFRHGGLMVFQIQLAKQLETVPTTRNYIAERELTLRSQEEAASNLCIAAE